MIGFGTPSFLFALACLAEQRRRPWAVEDFAFAFMKFKSGVSALLHSTELTEYTDHAFELRGEKGIIRIQGEQVQLLQSQLALSEPDSGFEWSRLQESSINRPPAASTYVEALEELINALEGNASLRSDGRVGRRSLEMVQAVYQSQLAGNRPVHFPVDLKTSGIDALRQSGHFVERNA